MSPPHIQALAFYGLKTDVKENAHFVTDSEVIYPAGGVLLLHDHFKKEQKVIKLPDKHKSIFSIVISPNKQYVALSERADQQYHKPSITIYDLQTLKRKKSLSIPFEGTMCTEFVAVQFTWDSKYLVAITGEPDWLLYYYNWESGKVESQTKAQNSNGTGTVSQVNCNPADAALIVVTGPFTFRLMNVSETVWRQWGWTKAENIHITSCMWLTADRVMFGTKNGLLMTVENGELRQNCCYKALEVREISMKKTEERGDIGETGSQMKQDQSQETASQLDSERHEVRCLTVFPKGFAFSCMNGIVHIFEKESPHKWNKRNLYKVMDKEFRIGEDEYVNLNVIQHISINPSQNRLMVTTLKSQLYVIRLFEEHIDQVPELPFQELGQRLHHSKINGLTVCSWKPIFMTSGEDDRSIRLWNYETKELELVKFYREDINSISLHPTGLFAVIGFSDKLRYMVVLIDDFHQMREFPIRNCKVCRFSNNGHMFAAVNGSVIQVFSAISFNNVYNLKGHNGTVRGLSWTASDDKLVSCGSDGAVYEWSMSTAKRVGEIVMKNHDFTDCAVSSEGKSSYVVGIDGEVKDVCNNAVIRNLKIIGCKLDNIVLARSDLMLFVTGGKGNVVSIQFPLLDKAVFAEFHMHNANVTGMTLSYDDQTLITVSEDATMCIWKLKNIEGKAIAMDKDFNYSEEILINKNDLQEKIGNIMALSTKINEMETEHAYQLRQVKAANNDNLRDIHNQYTTAIEDLKNKNEEMEVEHSHEINTINDDIVKLKCNHEKSVENAEADFNLRLIAEYDKYQAYEDQTGAMREEYEKKLAESAENKRISLKELVDMYEEQLREKISLIDQVNEKYELQLKQHEYIKQSIEDDADREIIDLKTEYEVQLKEERDLNVRLRGETGVFKKKMMNAQKDIEDYKHLVKQLYGEHKQYQSVNDALEKDIADLKQELVERDCTIQEKEKIIYDLKMNNQELEKYKFVLNFKINELKDQIEPKECENRELRAQIEDMENEEAKLLAAKQKMEFKLGILEEKLTAANSQNNNDLEAIISLKNTIKKIQFDIFGLSEQIQDPSQLKLSVKALMNKKYMLDEDFAQEKAVALEATEEFGRQRDHLEKRIVSLTKKLHSSSGNSRTDMLKIMEDNSVLLAKINELRSALKDSKLQCSEMKTLLGISTKHVSSIDARTKLRNACADHDKLKADFDAQIMVYTSTIETLKNENQRLLEKLHCQESSQEQEERESSTET